MLINNNEKNIIFQISFLPFAKILNGDGPQEEKLMFGYFFLHSR
jgi:hypothetical protein